MSVVSSTIAVGGVAGLVATGLMTGDGGDYRRPFWIGLGVTLLTLALAVWVLPHRQSSATGGVDWWGAVVLGAGLVLLLLPVSQGHAWGWTSPRVLGCLAASLAVLAGWVVLEQRTREPLVRPGMLADRRTVVPNVAGLMTGIALFASFLAVLQYVQAPPELAGYGFGASVLEAAVLFLVPGGIAGIALAPVAGRLVTRVGALPTLIAGAVSGIAGFALLAFLRGEPWLVIVAGVLTQAAVTLSYAALPALVVQAVAEEETGVANAVNSIARALGQALGSTVAVTLIASGLDPATGFPHPTAFTRVALMGAVASLAVLAAGVVGLLSDRRHGTGHRPDPLAPVEEATARAGEWSPVSGLR